MNFKKYLSCFFLVGITLFATTFAYGQGPVPCDDLDDPACNAPLDTWVIYFAVIALVATVWQLYRKQKAGTKKISAV